MLADARPRSGQAVNFRSDLFAVTCHLVAAREELTDSVQRQWWYCARTAKSFVLVALTNVELLRRTCVGCRSMFEPLVQILAEMDELSEAA